MRLRIGAHMIRSVKIPSTAVVAMPNTSANRQRQRPR